ncbi:lipid-binding SYLF domain-containing protein [Desulfobacter postgatei]|uniref:lipid-binding SYLF domain-containing protein n=1 Tax=Desulfobacter postgatei TaxID=2293 RepID=UPI00259BC3BD|nr:lipid-binding SYLF domain-containing protein [uncultured Desulfobacter sp.]
MKYLGYRLPVFLWVLALAAVTMMAPTASSAAGDKGIDTDAAAALQALYSQSDSAKTLGKAAKGVLVFPQITKGGFIVGGHYGEGVLIVDGKQIGRYSTVQASYGLQAGLQKYAYAMFFMTQEALDWLKTTKGWELGIGPSIVIVDEGAGKNFSTTTLKSEIYAFFFGQKGLMGGMGIQGTKISKMK